MTLEGKKLILQLITAAAVGDLSVIKQTVDQLHGTSCGSWKNCCHPKSGDTVLHVAARNGHVDILSYFHKKLTGANFELANLLGKTPLHEAAQFSQTNCIDYLVSSVGVRLDCLKQGDWTPLMLACTRPDHSAVQALAVAGADLLARNKDGWTCFHIACREGHLDIVAYLLATKSDLWNTVSNNGRTPLHTAALHGREQVVELLLRGHLIPRDQPDNCGTTPAMDAARADHVHVLELLVSVHQADVHSVDNMARQAIHLAAQAGSSNAVLYLIGSLGVDPNAKAGAGFTALHLACKEGQIKVAKILLRAGADINLKDNCGRTALHAAVTGRRLTCAQLLLDEGAEWKDYLRTFELVLAENLEFKSLFDNESSFSGT